MSGGQQSDHKAFPILWSKGDWKGIQNVIADKGYDSYKIRYQIQRTGKNALIPRRQRSVWPKMSDHDKEKYKTRSAIERFFGKLKDNKRLALRYDKLDATFFSFFALGCLKILNLLC